MTTDNQTSGQTGQSGQGDDMSTPQNRSISQLQADLAAMTETAKRALADLQNFKRRTEEERAELQIYANMKLLQALFPALDNFTRAFAKVPDNLKNNEWVKGIEAIENSLMNALKNLGLESIEQVQVPFDTNLHEILLEEEGTEGQIIQVFEKGYRFNGKTLRPAKVSVGKTKK